MKKIILTSLIIFLISCGSKKSEWVVLFDGDAVSGMRGYGLETFPWDSWSIIDGNLKTLPGKKGVDIISKEKYEDFELELEWRLQSGGNSGIFYFATENGDFIWQSAPEMQVLDNLSHHDRLKKETSAGALYDLIAPSRDVVKPLGEYNKVRIISKDGNVQHWLNGEKLLEYDYGGEMFQDLISKSKFREMPFFSRAKSGHIGLQGDHGEVWYRNIRIKRL